MIKSKHRNLVCNKTAFFSYHPHYPEPFNLGLRFVEASELHQQAIIIRSIIAEKIIQGLMIDFWKSPVEILPSAIESIPSDYDEILKWLADERKSIEI